ncbi:MAG TPA: hypothetical protein VG860_13465 [Terriglobia bacterium]|jgi:hypothetical protein|nr:hypothetical protein [Terriglobia bacterium]
MNAGTLGLGARTFPEYVVIIDGCRQPRTAHINEAIVTVATAHSQGRSVRCHIFVEVAQVNRLRSDFILGVEKRLVEFRWRGPRWTGQCSVIPTELPRFLHRS